MFLMATSPGPRGGASVLATAQSTFPRMGACVRASFSLPSFYDHFSAETGISDPGLAAAFTEALNSFSKNLGNRGELNWGGGLGERLNWFWRLCTEGD